MGNNVVSLEKITQDNLKDVLTLKVSADQERFVASNAISIAQAYFEKGAWFRAIKTGDDFVGFVMLFDPSKSQDKSLTDRDREQLFLWRFMIDHRYQGKGYGRQAIDLLIERAKKRKSFKRFVGSYTEGPGCPESFYRKCGFENTGDVVDGEIEFAMDL
jgi:diamine N-acetyltransferase